MRITPLGSAKQVRAHPLKVVVPYTCREPENVQALLDVDPIYVDVSGDDSAYWRLLRDLWGQSESFAIVEHDVVVTPGTISSFDWCGGEWCAAPYEYAGRENYAGLGCCRFDARLMKQFPELLDIVGEQHVGGHPRRYWCGLDGILSLELWANGKRACTQHVPVGHLDPEPSCLPCRERLSGRI